MRLPHIPLLPLLLAVALFALSLTPSLVPRGWLLQGALGGLVAALGRARRRGLGEGHRADVPEGVPQPPQRVLGEAGVGGHAGADAPVRHLEQDRGARPGQDRGLAGHLGGAGGTAGGDG